MVRVVTGGVVSASTATVFERLHSAEQHEVPGVGRIVKLVHAPVE